MPRVAALEAESFSTPWRAATFHSMLGRSGAVLRVLEVPPIAVAGYAVLWCVVDEGELANIAVDPRLRGRGLGGYLLDRVVEEAERRGVESLYLEVRDSNRRAREMYAARGFEEFGVRKDYYERPREDARVLVKRLGQGGPDGARPRIFIS